MLVYILCGLGFALFVPKGEFEIWLNKNYTISLDYFFAYITNLGDGNFSVLIIILLFFRKVYYGVLATISFIFSTIVVQCIKRFVFPGLLRPSAFFDKTLNLHYVPDIEIHHYNSFPSGHTSGAFTIFLILAIVFRNKYLDVLFFVLAFLVGLSRVYLLQHFFIDTYFGAIIGVSTTLIVYYFTSSKANWLEKPKLNKSIIKLFSRNEIA